MPSPWIATGCGGVCARAGSALHDKTDAASATSAAKPMSVGLPVVNNPLTCFDNHATLMTPAHSIEGFEARLKLYHIDERICDAMKECWGALAPLIERAIDDFLVTAAHMPRLAEMVQRHRALIKTLELSHFEALLNGTLDARYVASCRKTVEEEAAIGFDGRVRSSAGNFVLRVALDALARKYRLSPKKLAAHAKAVSQFIAFDVANAMSLHRTAAEQATEVRRKAIDSAIEDFAATIGDVVKAIKEAATSLSSSSSTLQQVADDHGRPDGQRGVRGDGDQGERVRHGRGHRADFELDRAYRSTDHAQHGHGAVGGRRRAAHPAKHAVAA